MSFRRRAAFIREVGKEGGDWRIWTGIHYPIHNVSGVALGKAVVQKFIAWASSDGSLASNCRKLRFFRLRCKTHWDNKLLQQILLQFIRAVELGTVCTTEIRRAALVPCSPNLQKPANASARGGPSADVPWPLGGV
jgi:hypothetical protein